MTADHHDEPVNHRTRVGQQRRERTRQKIVAAALRVFARMGTDAPMIEDFIAEAGISRGTFYNHFSATSELLQATIEWLSADIIESIESELSAQPSPLLRLTVGLRFWLGKAEQDLAWAAFVARPEFIKELQFEPVRRDLLEGRQSGQFSFPSERVAFDMLAGTLILAMRSYVQGQVPAGYTTDIIRITLQGLGASPASIELALAQPMPVMRRPPMSLPPA
ncbi:TetR/AcrR family transcriptional regulator [Pokkaliibacter sp. MBI-7]|uniref:TetR/AcrR family transcriptional regulator n=1 Tax=Pokkaliibacter sp. MBI-7 TaxID=3040600 RepID=UPI00244CD399|nr:TetR/AcrR family transcriptional regulator [Pokkaliibacter sp. MBI-7]MDH2431792.1 TetR/AcrR family transcriptional regulator [Pokkaliibacter sp. MBI-7]